MPWFFVRKHVPPDPFPNSISETVFCPTYCYERETGQESRCCVPLNSFQSNTNPTLHNKKGWVSEWFKVPVLKTGIPKWYRGFESSLIRNIPQVSFQSLAYYSHLFILECVTQRSCVCLLRLYASTMRCWLRLDFSPMVINRLSKVCTGVHWISH